MSDMRERLRRIERGIDDPRVDVLELVNWVYSEQRAHQAERRGNDMVLLLGRGISADGVARIAELNMLGCRVDVSGGDTGELHPVAEAVHGLVVRLQAGGKVPAWLIRHFGERAAVPDGFDLEVKLGPLWKAKGPRYQIADGGTLPQEGAFKVVHDGSNAKVPLYCPLELSYGFDYQAEVRREYEHWHLALRRLVQACAGCAALGRVIVTGPSIAREPWIERGEVALPTEPSRRAERAPTRHARDAVQEMVLAVLFAATQSEITQCGDGLWRVRDERGGAGFGNDLVNRLVAQGLAVYSVERISGPIVLQVTAQGHEALKVARLVA